MRVKNKRKGFLLVPIMKRECSWTSNTWFSKFKIINLSLFLTICRNTLPINWTNENSITEVIYRDDVYNLYNSNWKTPKYNPCYENHRFQSTTNDLLLALIKFFLLLCPKMCLLLLTTGCLWTNFELSTTQIRVVGNFKSLR